jgi:hypothetical protein
MWSDAVRFSTFEMVLKLPYNLTNPILGETIMPDNRKLRVFLCHASQGKTIVRELYQRLLAEGWIDSWLDDEI